MEALVMDAYDIAEKIKKCWADVHPKYSGEINKPKTKIRVVVNTNEGYREIIGVSILSEDKIELTLDQE